MNLNARLHELRHGFHSTFWIANTLELFERLAFYGSKAVLSVFLADRVGLRAEASTLAGIFSGVIYSLPIVAGVLVDKYGFRRTLIACFSIFAVGYFLIGMAGMQFGQELVAMFGKKAYVITVLLFTAIGGSLIKPCIVGTVAKTSKPGSKAFGFSIYYTLVNIGGAIGPIIALQVRENLAIEYVLVMSAFTSLLLLIGTLLFFKEPPAYDETEPTEVRTFGKIFQDMLTVFSNYRFILFLVIFSGLYIMFWQIFYLLPFYTLDVLKFERFEIIETVDAICVILFTIPVTLLMKKLKPMTAMTIGLLVASVAWTLLGAGASIITTVVAIAIYSFGEAAVSPRFYEYVGSLAPKDQIGTYMGFAFLPVAIGSFVAGPVADWLRGAYMQTNPAMMWYIVAAIGIGSTVSMMLYNTFLIDKVVVKE